MRLDVSRSPWASSVTNLRPGHIYGCTGGQVPIEYLLLTGAGLLIATLIAVQAGMQLELMAAHSAAKTGALEGVTTDTLAVYPAVTFEEYQNQKPVLLQPSDVRVLRVELIDEGYNSTYGRRKFRLRAWLSGPPMESSLRESLSDRVNFCMRRSISRTFRTENLTGTYHNPALSDHYVFTTSEAVWVPP
ncbi:hypothetical protein [Methanothermobacter sp. THM-2]|uniref:hypothetical protein n=1 Tax=Methanothermobacter sp. THM-2 TaxID=2606912 RepID=UPI0013655327|nr:hypothetical protein [Methanothermobacter sp. THM-2]QHN08153.1 hypothetical protein FZP68_05040 [Methanothermobacter sp. THM-2]